MPIVTYNNREYYARDGELLLDCLTRHCVEVESPCEDGNCGRCLARVAADDGSGKEVFSCRTVVWTNMVVDGAEVGSH